MGSICSSTMRSCTMSNNPLTGITVVWCCIQICLIGLALSSWISTDREHVGMCEKTSADGVVAPVLKTLSVSGAGSFVLVWQTLVAIGVSVWGTLVLRKFRDPFAVGIWFGGLVVLANLMLCISVNAADRVLFGDVVGRPSEISDLAVATFATLLCMLYTILAAQVLVFRSVIVVKQGGMSPVADADDGNTGNDNEMMFIQRVVPRTGEMMGVVRK